MAIKKLLQQLIEESGGNRKLLPDAQSPDPIGAKRGVGTAAKKAASSAVVGTVRVEVITVYSHLVITADGAYEMPMGWPGNGDYPAGTPIPGTLPGSLLNNGGVLSLDTSVDYYQQKRVHIAAYLTKAPAIGGSTSVPVVTAAEALEEDRFYIPLAAPFDGSEYYSGIDSFTQIWEPKLEMARIANMGSLAARRVQELIAAGVTLI